MRDKRTAERVSSQVWTPYKGIWGSMVPEIMILHQEGASAREIELTLRQHHSDYPGGTDIRYIIRRQKGAGHAKAKRGQHER